MKVTVMAGQTLADISLQEYGTIEAMPQIALENGISLSAVLTAGQVLNCPDKVYDNYMMNYAKNNNIKPATR
jgi:nucleoid-associated protein YgaU